MTGRRGITTGSMDELPRLWMSLQLPISGLLGVPRMSLFEHGGRASRAAIEPLPGENDPSFRLEADRPLDEAGRGLRGTLAVVLLPLRTAASLYTRAA